MRRAPLRAHVGHVLAHGFAIDTRARVLALWSPGALVHRVGAVWIVRLASPVRVEARAALGAPLVRVGGALCGLALDAEACEALGAGEGWVVLGVDGAAVASHLGASVDVSQWLDVSAVQRVEVVPLGAPPPALVVARKESAAEVLRVPPPSADARAVQDALAAGDAAATTPPPWWLRALARAVAWLRSGRGATSGAAGSPGAIIPAGAKEPSWFERTLGALEDRIASLVMRSSIGRLLAQKQAEYMERLLSLLDRGDLGEALRHAIPLAAEDGPPATRPALGVPQPTSGKLDFGPRAASRSALGFGPGLYAHLRARYQKLFERLRDAGRVDDAAYVLAELLGDARGAVTFLEGVRRFETAARLADSRQLAPGLRVRQWLLAGNTQRALQIARAYGAFAEAVALLSRTHPALAQQLQLHWAELRASQGEPFVAYELARGVAGAEQLARRWLELAAVDEGPTGARALARLLGDDPAAWPARRDAVRALLERTEDSLDADRRVTFARELGGVAPTAVTRTVARHLARALVRDVGAQRDVPTVLLDAVVVHAEDAALRADRPAVTRAAAPVRLESLGVAPVLHVRASDTGAQPAACAAWLPDGRTLVGLGEGGAQLLGRDGRVVQRFDAPTSRLAVSDAGTLAITIAARGELVALSRIDLVQRRAARWWEARLGAFTESFDGERWLVVEDGRAALVDALDPRWSALWHLDAEDARAVYRRRGARAVVASGAGELFAFDEGTMTLRQRRSPPHPELDPSAPMPIAVVAGRDPSSFLLRSQSDAALTVDAGALVSAVHGEAGVALVSRHEAGMRVDLRATATLRPLLHVLLDGASQASVRLDTHLVIADDRGRVLVIDALSGALRRSLRTR